MELSLKGKIAIVGGASMGIGYGIARMLAAEGARVAMTARREPALREAAERLRAETGTEVLPVQADSRRADDCKRVVETVVAQWGGVDILVNNDGAPPLGDIMSFDDAAWQKAMEQNFMYVVRMVRGTVPHMKARGGGGIVNISAISAIQPIAGFGLSVASWGGMIGYAKTASIELGPFGINVNTVCPGYIETSRLEKVFAAGGEDTAKMRADLVAQVPMRRIGTVDDVAGLVALLVSPRGNYITGATIQVDGGLLRHVR
ncbi:MAG: SDR family oxidoreductase [Alphaproteobacteria bacterium]|nr:SDR family oxidoreductase [Alphaproteobacteria bacterium]